MIHFDDELWDFVDDAIRKLEESWQTSGGANLAELVPPPGDPRREQVLVELIKLDQEYRWKSGREQKLESYLDEWSELRNKPRVLKELLEAECRTRAAVSAIPTGEELRDRFPEISEQIDLAAVQAEVEGACTANSGQDAALQEECDTPSRTSEPTAQGARSLLPLKVGEQFGRYEIRALLGKGGMGAVYRAYDTLLEREVALKIPRFDPTAEPAVLERFLREAKAAARIRHPNICPIYDAGEIEGTYYLAMAFIEGEALVARIEDHTISPPEAADVALKLAQALDTVHAAGVVHRDITPSNVILDQSGEPLLMDFGLAREGETDQAASGGGVGPSGKLQTASRLTGVGLLSGTPAYVSPEQARGRPADARSDLYGLGVVLFQMLTGELPFTRPLPELLEQIAEEQPPKPRSLRPGLDARLEAICLKAMAKDPADRYQSAKEMSQALEEYLETPPKVIARLLWRGGLFWALVLGGMVALILALAVYLKTVDHVPVPSPPKPVPPAGSRRQLVRWIETGGGADICVSPDGATIYAACGLEGHDAPLKVFDVGSGRLLQSIPFPSGPGAEDRFDHFGIAASADGRYLYTTNYYQDYISRVDLQHYNARTDLPIGGVPGKEWATSVAITPDQKKLLVLLGGDGQTKNLENDQVSIVDIADGKFTLIAEVPLDDEAPIGQKIGFSSDSRFAYVATRPQKSSAPTLYEIRLTPPYQVSRSLPFPGGILESVAVSSKLSRVFVSDSGHRKIWAVDLETFKRVAEIDLQGNAPGPLAIRPEDDLLITLCPAARMLVCLDAEDGSILAEVDELRRNALDIEFSPGFAHVFVSNRHPQAAVAVIDLRLLVAQYSVVFASDRAGGSYQIYVMDGDGENVVRLTNRPVTDRYARWSPDGRRIAFVSDRQGLPRICVMDRSGTQVSVLENTDPVFQGLNSVPLDWSPDGRQIAFIGDDRRAIRIVDLETHKIETLVDQEILVCRDGEDHRYFCHHGLCWRNRDGAILFTSQDPGWSLDSAIFLIDPGSRKLAPIPNAWGEPAFLASAASSPDGTKLAVARFIGKEYNDIFLTSADGSEPTCLTDATSRTHATPEWFPDGKRIVYSARNGGFWHICTIPTSGGEPTQLTHGDSHNVDPDVTDRLRGLPAARGRIR